MEAHYGIPDCSVYPSYRSVASDWRLRGHDHSCAGLIAIVVMFLWSLIEPEATINAEEEALRKKLEDQKETAERRRQKQDRLGEFLAPCQTCCS